MTDAQRTESWHAQRRGRITGSQAGALLGLSKWKTKEQAVREWVRNAHGAPSEVPDNPAFAHGRNHERAAQLALMRETGIIINDCGFYPYEDWLGASPDGFTDCGAVVEVKVPFSWRGVESPEPKTLTEQPNYYAQVQLEMLCAGKDKAFFGQYRPAFGDPLGADYVPDFLHMERVAVDQAWREKYLPELRMIYAELQEELKNPAHLEPLRVTLSSDEAIQLVDYISELDASMEQAKVAREQSISRLVELADGKNAEICGRKLTLVQRAGSISYAKAIKALRPDADLEPWRGAPSESWQLR